MVRKTAFAASIDESKGILVGILTEINEDAVNMVSLDGFRLALAKEKMLVLVGAVKIQTCTC